MLEFVKLGYKTQSIEIKSFASPEGTVDANDDVSERRNKSTVRYTKQILKKLLEKNLRIIFKKLRKLI